MYRSTIALAALTALVAVACVAAARIGMSNARPRIDAEESVRSYAGTVAASLSALALKGSWPRSGYEGLALSAETRPAPSGRLVYDIVATVSDEAACQGAIEAGRDLAAEVHVGTAVLPPPAVMPYREGRHEADPTVEICAHRVYPLVLRFRHVAEAPAPR